MYVILQSGSEKSSRSRLGSASDLAALRGENGELDYKKMYEQAITENDRLKDKLRKSDEELRETKQTLEKINTVVSNIHFSTTRVSSITIRNFIHIL